MLTVDSAFLDSQISGALLICFENDRPLQGAIASLDWRFNGVFSKLVKNQILTGAEGETLYVPLLWNSKTLHFVIVGGGLLRSNSDRMQISNSLLPTGIKKVEELKLGPIGVSQKDWEIATDHPAVQGGALWILN